MLFDRLSLCMCLVKGRAPPILHQCPSNFAGQEGAGQEGACGDQGPVMDLAFESRCHVTPHLSTTGLVSVKEGCCA